MKPTSPFKCLDCTAISHFSSQEQNRASRIRCAACGSIYLERITVTQDTASVEASKPRFRRKSRRSKTTPEERTQLLSAPTRYREVVIRNRAEDFKKRRAAQLAHLKAIDFIPITD